MRCKPTNARLLFGTRTLANGAFILAIFIPLAFILSVFSFAWIGDILVILALYYLFFQVLEKRSFGFDCPHFDCGKYVATNTPWKCGFCNRDNRSVTKYPFIHRCEHCEAEPKAYKCHHCGNLIFLTEDRLEKSAATCLGLTEATSADEATQRQKEKDALSHEIAMTELAAKLDQSKQMLERGKRRSPVEEIEESFNRHHARVMGSHEFARRQKAVNAEKFKDDPDMLQRANESVDDWLRGRI